MAVSVLQKIAGVYEDMKKLEHFCIAGENVKWAGTIENSITVKDR